MWCCVVLCGVVQCSEVLVLLVCLNLAQYTLKDTCTLHAFLFSKVASTLMCTSHSLTVTIFPSTKLSTLHSRDEKYKLLCSSYSVPPHIAVVMQFAKGTLKQKGPGSQYACTYTFADSVHPSVLRAFKNTE